MIAQWSTKRWAIGPAGRRAGKEGRRRAGGQVRREEDRRAGGRAGEEAGRRARKQGSQLSRTTERASRQDKRPVKILFDAMRGPPFNLVGGWVVWLLPRRSPAWEVVSLRDGSAVMAAHSLPTMHDLVVPRRPSPVRRPWPGERRVAGTTGVCPATWSTMARLHADRRRTEDALSRQTVPCGSGRGKKWPLGFDDDVPS